MPACLPADSSSSLRSKARSERFWIELNSINRNSRSDSENGAIQLCAALPVALVMSDSSYLQAGPASVVNVLLSENQLFTAIEGSP